MTHGKTHVVHLKVWLTISHKWNDAIKEIKEIKEKRKRKEKQGPHKWHEERGRKLPPLTNLVNGNLKEEKFQEKRENMEKK